MHVPQWHRGAGGGVRRKRGMRVARRPGAGRADAPVFGPRPGHQRWALCGIRAGPSPIPPGQALPGATVLVECPGSSLARRGDRVTGPPARRAGAVRHRMARTRDPGVRSAAHPADRAAVAGVRALARTARCRVARARAVGSGRRFPARSATPGDAAVSARALTARDRLCEGGAPVTDFPRVPPPLRRPGRFGAHRDRAGPALLGPRSGI